MAEGERFDIAVVGAGPTGSITAYAAARRGWRVALIDQRRFPRDKSCGDGLGPGVATLLARLGLEHVLDGEVPAEALTVYGPDGVLLETDLPPMSGQGFVVPRVEFDDRLHRAALAAGAVDLTGHKLMDTWVDGGRRLARLRAGGVERVVEAHLLVGADGAYSAVRRLLGQAKNPPKHTAIALRAYSKSTQFDPGGALRPRLIFEFSRELLPAYGWIFPTGNGVVNVGVGVMLHHMHRRHYDLRAVLAGFVDSCRQRGIELGDPFTYRAHHLPTAGARPRLAHERAVLLGDAGSMINPVSGEGIVYGMRAADQLVQALPARLADPGGLAAALGSFERGLRREQRMHIVSSLAAHRLLSSPWWTKVVIRAAQRDPLVLRDAIDLLFDQGRMRPSTTVRILRHGW